MTTDSPRTVLVVDDNSTNRLVLTRSLEKAGYRVLAAEDGFKAIDIATQHQPDLVLLDMMMPERDGLETCKTLKSREETKPIPVIFVTAMSESEQIVRAFAAGGCDYITKPFRSDEVLARVSAHVRLRQVERELRERNEQLEDLTKDLMRLSSVDPLTKLLNRRTWQDAVEREHERFLRHGHSYSIVIADVDRFKSFNDSRGHQAGDECLRRIAKTIVSTCRRVDSVGRYGGEEFIILAPETSSESSVKLAERVRMAVWSLAIPNSAALTAGRVTISLGAATSAGDSWEAVLKQADDALYVAKRSGRNMTYCADDGAPSFVQAVEGVAAVRPDSSDSGVEERPTVLVVDDERLNRMLCQGCLERAGYRVRSAEDGAAALACVYESPPDVIVMDVMMPGMDGLECTRRLKADPETCGIPVILVSALTEGEHIIAGLQAGADEYVGKPIRTAELVLRVRSMAGRYKDHQDLLIGHQMRGEHMRILNRLVEFCREVAVSSASNEVVAHTIAATKDVTRARRISIMFPDEDERRLRIVKSTGIDEELAATVTVPIGEPIAGRVYATGLALVVNSEAENIPDKRRYDTRFFASVPLLCAPLGASGRVLGVLNVTDRVGRQPFEAHELEYVELIAKVASTAIHNVRSREAHTRASDTIMVALAKLAEHRDSDTGGHLDRVARYCCMLAEELRTRGEFRDRIDEAFMYNLARSVPLHDIGKVAVPDSILLHPGRLTPAQMDVMRTHAAIGARTIGTLIERAPDVGFLEMAADIAHYHHEWYDGSGYPLGLVADAIPLSARITALADVYDALTTSRPYREAVRHEKASTMIVEASGTQFDPAVVEAFLCKEEAFRALASAMADERPERLAMVEYREPSVQ